MKPWSYILMKEISYFNSSQTVRSFWGSLMRAGTARRDHPDVQLNNVITLATRVRITILRVHFSNSIHVVVKVLCYMIL